MGRAGLLFTNAACREVTTQAIQPSVSTTVLPTAASFPETLRSLQAPASIGGMVNTFNQFGRCAEECQRIGIDVYCGEFTVPADAAYSL